MKNLKIMLAGLTIVAAGGSSMAFKAANLGSAIMTGTSPTSCLILTPNSTFTADQDGAVYATTSGGSTTNCVKSDLSVRL